MKDNPLLAVIAGAFALALVLGVLFVAWLIGREALTALAGVLIGALALALVIGALALPIRAYRRNDAAPIVEHHYHDGTRTVERTHTIDGRAALPPEVKLLQLPAASAGAAFPELLRASYRAGLLAAPAQDQAAASGGQLRELDPADPDAWGGELRP